MLKIYNISKHFDGIDAAKNVSATFQKGVVYALIGPNGAGKTTLLNIINGFIRPDNGNVYLGNTDITNLYPYKISRMGISRLFQDIRVFPKMTLIDNMLLPVHFVAEENPLLSVVKIKANQKKEKKYFDLALSYLDEFGLADKYKLYASSLSYGQSKLLALARLFIADSQILLLDEPVSGVELKLRKRICDKIRDYVNTDKTVIFVEHEIETVKSIADQVFLMNEGKIVLDGNAKKVFLDKRTKDLYLPLKSLKQSTALNYEKKSTNSNILKVNDVYASYNSTNILKGIDINIGDKEIVGLIGPNGAGKSTLLKVLSGILPSKKGDILYKGINEKHTVNITNISLIERRKNGIGYCIQGGQIFTELSVEENLKIPNANINQKERELNKEKIFTLFPTLFEKKKLRSGLLSGGERQLLALALVLMNSNNNLLLLDEPTAGLGPKYRKQVLQKINDIRKNFSTSILLVEQHVNDIVPIVDRIYEMKNGKIVGEKTIEKR